MSTPEQIAERAEVDQWIADWLAKDAARYDKEMASRAEVCRKATERGAEVLPDDLEEHLNGFDFGEHMRLRFPVGTFMDNARVDDTGAWKPSDTQLFQIFETGKMLVNAALGHPDATEEFLEQCREEWGQVTDEALDYLSVCDPIPRRDPITNEWPGGSTHTTGEQD